MRSRFDRFLSSRDVRTGPSFMNSDLDPHRTAASHAGDPIDDDSHTKGDAPVPGPSESSAATAWQGLIAALRLVFPVGRNGRDLPTNAHGICIHWIVPLGLIVGLAWAGLFRVSWRIFGETGSLRPIPALAIVLLDCCFTGTFLVLGFARTVDTLTGSTPAMRPLNRSAPFSQIASLALCLIILTEFILILSIRPETPWWPSTGWRAKFNWIYPAPIYRPLILAPLWGRWGMIVAACVGRTGRDAEPEVRAFVASSRPLHLLTHAILPIVLSVIYCAKAGNYFVGLKLGLLVFGVTYMASVIMARRGEGHTRYSLHAAAQIAQIASLAVHRALWSEIHG